MIDFLWIDYSSVCF